LPGVRTFQIGIPERPGATLPRTNGVDRAPPRLGIEKGAVAVRELAKAHAFPDGSRVLEFDFAGRFVEEIGNLLNLVSVHPHVAFRAGTAIAALRAFEFQAVLVPGLTHAADCMSAVTDLQLP